MKNRQLLWMFLPCLLVLLGTSACAGSASGVEVLGSEPVATVSSVPSPLATATTPAAEMDVVGMERKVRNTLSQADAVRALPQDVAAEVLEAMRNCSHCLLLSGSTTIQGKIYQLAAVATAADAVAYAAFALQIQADGRLKVALSLSGADVSLVVGAHETLVVQESIYLQDDPVCCASGQSVTIYRYNGSQFVAGEKFSKLNGSTQESQQHG